MAFKTSKKCLICVFLIFFPIFVNAQIPQADKILVEKSKRTLSLYSKNQLIKKYSIALGPNPQGHKTQEGDGKTPEGNYIIDSRKSDSAFHLSLHISYPNEQDIEQARNRGVSPGGQIMIHGLPNGLGWMGFLQKFKDWTQGCIAVTNSQIEEIWKMVPDGTPIEIKP